MNLSHDDKSGLVPTPSDTFPSPLLDVAYNQFPSEHSMYPTLRSAAKHPQLSEELSISAPTYISAALADMEQDEPPLLSMIPTTDDAHQATTSDSSSWQEFMEAYAAGHWDALKPPPKPVQGMSPGSIPRSKSFSMRFLPHYAGGSAEVSADEPLSGIEEITRLPVSRGQKALPRPQSIPRPSSTLDAATKTLAQRRMGEAMALPQSSDANGPFIESGIIHSASLAALGLSTPGSRSIPDLTQAVTDAATVRLAGANAKVAPLALSSPESKLSLFPSSLGLCTFRIPCLCVV